MLQTELNALTGMYAELEKKTTLQDSMLTMQKSNMLVCEEGWNECSQIVNYQRVDILELKQRFKRRDKIYKGIIAVLLAALIIK